MSRFDARELADVIDAARAEGREQGYREGAEAMRRQGQTGLAAVISTWSEADSTGLWEPEVREAIFETLAGVMDVLSELPVPPMPAKDE